TSVKRAVSHLGYACEVTADLSVIQNADRVIFPGVGAAGSAMQSVKKRGLDRALANALAAKKPVLGICLGTQIILSQSEENNAQCLGFIKGVVRAFPHDMQQDGQVLKVPHMGWNNLDIVKPHPVLKGILPEHRFYFVHSYYPAPDDPGEILATTTHGITFPSVIGKNNLVATQFHPEKSGPPGLTILKNFCEWEG
ncbi:MAG: imidazole glycerol phosphate synthase subunit HisH, partial [Deltaproteobacteria bacterium]|nr:imidazole glycerol phosphate synthase subunit HisH [Deltaproteobacteria bacterium]